MKLATKIDKGLRENFFYRDIAQNPQKIIDIEASLERHDVLFTEIETSKVQSKLHFDELED